jgi:hypothetical protein
MSNQSALEPTKMWLVDPSRTPFPFLDNGATELVWDNHCNTAVVRWTLRERGVVRVWLRFHQPAEHELTEATRAFVDYVAVGAL